MIKQPFLDIINLVKIERGCFMNKIYNTQEDFARGFVDFLKKAIPNIRKTQLNIIPYIIWGMIKSESAVASDIAGVLKDNFSLVQPSSIIKRIRRFFNNSLFQPDVFWEHIIRFVIDKYKPKHNKIHIIIDHMFSHDNYTVLMFSLRIGKQGIPLWFKSFKGKPTEAFLEDNIIDGISKVSSLFDKKYQLIFLADRWFNSQTLMQYIDSLGHIYCFRLKKNIKIFIYDKKEGHKVWKYLYDLKPHKYHAIVYNDIELFDSKYVTNIVHSKYLSTDDPWIIVTNGDISHAIQNYSFRFGGIETLFKQQKSNGFFLEAVNNASEKAFTSMYTLVCLSTLYLTILGTEYSKNTKCYKDCKIESHKTYKDGKKVRVMSLFKTGLTLFKIAIESSKYIRLPIRFILYDI